jgi:hypothetical protein
MPPMLGNGNVWEMIKAVSQTASEMTFCSNTNIDIEIECSTTIATLKATISIQCGESIEQISPEVNS